MERGYTVDLWAGGEELETRPLVYFSKEWLGWAWTLMAAISQPTGVWTRKWASQSFPGSGS